MLGYAISVYVSKDVGDKIIKIAEALEKLDERKIKNSELVQERSKCLFRSTSNIH